MVVRASALSRGRRRERTRRRRSLGLRRPRGASGLRFRGRCRYEREKAKDGVNGGCDLGWGGKTRGTYPAAPVMMTFLPERRPDMVFADWGLRVLWREFGWRGIRCYGFQVLREKNLFAVYRRRYQWDISALFT